MPVTVLHSCLADARGHGLTSKTSSRYDNLQKILFFTNQSLSPLPLKLVLSHAVIGWGLMAPVTMLKWCTTVSNTVICRYCIIIIIIIIIILCWLQLICEAYDLMKNVLGLSNDEMAKVFEEWNKGELDSFLIEISSQIMAYKVKREREGSRGGGYALIKEKQYKRKTAKILLLFVG